MIKKDCRTCNKYHKVLPRPRVGGLIALFVNHIVAADSFEFKFEDFPDDSGSSISI